MAINKIPSDSLFVSDLDWRTSRYHFSFADHNDTEKMQFGVLRALNDETIQPNNGFDTHPHDEMEIITYCVRGELSHTDNIGNQVINKRGDVQYICAGSGIMHAEMNATTNQALRFLQIWILPNKAGLPPQYSSKSFPQHSRQNRLLQIASGNGTKDAFQINQDANVFVSELTKGEQIEFVAQKNRQGYLVCIEGLLNINGIELDQHEALQLVGNQSAVFEAVETSHLLLVEMAEG